MKQPQSRPAVLSGWQPTHVLPCCVASHVLLLLELLVIIILAVRSSTNDGWSTRNVGLQKSILCSHSLIFLCVLYFILKWNVWGRVVLFILIYCNHFLCGFAQLSAPFLVLTNMCIFLCLPIPVGQCLCPSSVPMAWWAVCGPLGEAQLGTGHKHIPVEQIWLGWIQVGREPGGAFPSCILKGHCQSVNASLCCPLQGCSCFGAQLTEERLVCGSQQSLGVNLCWASVSYQRAETLFLGIFMFITELMSSWYSIMPLLNSVGPQEWRDVLNYYLRSKPVMDLCNMNYSTFPVSFLRTFLQTFTPLPNAFSPLWISSQYILCEAGPLCRMPMTLQIPVTPCSRDHQYLCIPKGK